VHLVASGTEATLSVINGKVVSVRGLDTSAMARRLEVAPADRDDLLAEAMALTEQNEISQGQAVGAAKEVLQEAIAAWLGDSGRQVDLVESDLAANDRPTISLAHAVVEVVLSDQSGALRTAILPDTDVLVRRADRFLELYSPLRLSEEADLIVAKVTGQRTVREISDRSPHGGEEVHNLLAALISTGVLEESPLAEVELEPTPIPAPVSEPGFRRRQVPVWILLVALAALLLGIIGVVKIWQGSDESAGMPPTDEPQWAIVVDMGCEPQDLQRVLKKARENPKTLKPVAADAGEGSPCWRLVWGRFANSESANQAIPDIPGDLVADGFTPHAIELAIDPSNETLPGEEG